MIFQVDNAILEEFSKLHVQKTCFNVLTALVDCMVPVPQDVPMLMHMYLNSSDTVCVLCKWHIET